MLALSLFFNHYFKGKSFLRVNNSNEMKKNLNVLKDNKQFYNH